MEPILILGALGAFFLVHLLRGDREGRALERLKARALADPAARRAAVERLEAQVKAVRDVPAARIALGRLYLAEDRAEAALVELERAGDDVLLSERLIAERDTVKLLTLVRLRRFAEAEALLDRYPRPFLDEDAAASWADARAQVRLGRGDVEGALAVLEAAEPVPSSARAQLELTRVRILAERGRDDEVVWTRLRAQPREVLQTLARRHGAERAAAIALRLLEGSAYR